MLYIHVGRGKVGSSTIQHFAASKRDALEAAGYLYPDLGEPSLHHFKLSTELTSPSYREGDAVRKLQAILREARTPNVILSSEYFLGKNKSPGRYAERMKDVVGDHPAKIIVYVRDYPDWVVSLYNQKTKRGLNPLNFNEYLKDNEFKRNISLTNSLGKWIQAFGAENVIVRSLDPSVLYENDLLLDFVHICGIDVDLFRNEDLSQYRTNASADWTFLEFVRSIVQQLRRDRPDGKDGASSKEYVRYFRQFRVHCEKEMALRKLKPPRVLYPSPKQVQSLRALFDSDLEFINSKLNSSLPYPPRTEPAKRKFVPSASDVPDEVWQAYADVVKSPRVERTWPPELKSAAYAILDRTPEAGNDAQPAAVEAVDTVAAPVIDPAKAEAKAEAKARRVAERRAARRKAREADA